MSRGTGTAAIAVVVLLVLLAAGLGIGTSYYAFVPRPASVTTATVTSTELSTITVEGGVSSSTSETRSSGAAIDAARVYNDSYRSVVTVDGFILQTFNSPFGQVTRIGEVFGSGFVTRYDGGDYIVTNFHVVNGATNMTVILWNGDAYPAMVVGTDPYSDLAIVKVPTAPSSELRALDVSSSSSVRVGDSVAAIGNPFGLSGSLTVGVVSQLGRTLAESSAGNYSIADVIQFSAPINPGSSGGPLLNIDGRVIGLTTATVSGSQGVGFAIPSNAVAREIGSMIANGTYGRHPYLGISTADMNYHLAQANGNNVTYGVLVESVVAGGPAANAGIRAGTKQAMVGGSTYVLGGDVIVSINGTRVINLDAMASYLEENAVPGHALTVGIVRGTTLISTTVTVGSLPSAP